MRQEMEDHLQALEAENETLKRANTELRAETRDLQKDCRTLRQQLARKEVEALEGACSPTPSDQPSIIGYRRSTDDAGTLDNYEKLYCEVGIVSSEKFAAPPAQNGSASSSGREGRTRAGE